MIENGVLKRFHIPSLKTVKTLKLDVQIISETPRTITNTLTKRTDPVKLGLKGAYFIIIVLFQTIEAKVSFTTNAVFYLKVYLIFRIKYSD